MIDTKQFISEIKEVFKVKQIYEARWVWYHTILAVEILFTNILLLAILVVLSFK